MKEGTKKVFGIIGAVVACIILLAFLFNILLPNGTKLVVDNVEDGIYKATGIAMDLNGDGVKGSANRSYTAVANNTNNGAANKANGTVNGFS